MEDLVDALETVLRGDIAVSARMNARLLARRFRGPTDERYSELSNREMQIFLLIGAGRSTGDIASELCLSPKTVGAHRENIKTKLRLASAAELEREALLHVERLGESMIPKSGSRFSGKSYSNKRLEWDADPEKSRLALANGHRSTLIFEPATRNACNSRPGILPPSCWLSLQPRWSCRCCGRRL